MAKVSLTPALRKEYENLFNAYRKVTGSFLPGDPRAV